MIEIKGKLTQFDFKALQKCGDLIYCDGPLLSHYISEYGDHYLAYWVDADDLYNRWIIVRTCLDHLRQYVKKEISLYQLMSNPADHIVWITDIDDKMNLNNTQILAPEEVPEEYLPSASALYEFENNDPLLLGDTETYELQVPNRDRNLFAQFIERMGWSAAALRKVAVL